MYRAVNDRLAVDFQKLKLPASEAELIPLLRGKGIACLEVDLVLFARQCLGKPYRRGAHPSEAPNIFDCSGLTKWLYGQKGIWLPRYSIDQRDAGRKIQDIKAGDLVFAKGYKNYYWTDKEDAVGHVGMAIDESAIIHAANGRRGVVIDPLNAFCGSGKYRGARRYVPLKRTVYTLIIPKEFCIETSTALRWKILQWL